MSSLTAKGLITSLFPSLSIKKDRPLHLLSLPPELVAQILEAADREDLKNLRLVCRSIERYARYLLFSSLLLLPTDLSLQRWDSLLKTKATREDARHALIYTYQERYPNARQTVAGWTPPEEYHAALSRLRELPHLDKVELRFTSVCLFADPSFENKDFRSQALGTLFAAIQAHNAEVDNRKIRSLAIKNLQNEIPNELLDSTAFRDTQQGLRELHLQVGRDGYDSLFTHAYVGHRGEEPFWPGLRRRWIAPIVNQLTSLTIYCHNYWGYIPEFELEGLHIPGLRQLALGNYTFARDTQLDWILAHRHLEELTFDDCPIIHHIEVSVLRCRVLGIDDSLFTDAPATIAPYDRALQYLTTWTTYLDRIRTGLTKLKKYQMGSGHWHCRNGCGVSITTTAESSCRLGTWTRNGS